VEPVELIRDACFQKRISLTKEAINCFQIYQSQLIDWNKKVNLISKKDEPRIVTRHFLQSLGLLTVFNFPQESRILDLGTGGGFPGLPIKIIRSDLDLVLVEATQKKVIFLKELIKMLGLKNVTALPVRIESLRDVIKPVDIVISRAVADLRSLVRWSNSFFRKGGGCLIAIKGKRLNEEIEDLKTDSRIGNTISWNVISYNPFPELFVLNDSHVVVVNIIK
jgi:16S rRNA (guanine527-N7)-methyltransferase